MGVRTPPRFPKGGKRSLSSTRAKAASETKTEGNGQLAFATNVCQPNDHSPAVNKYAASPLPLKVVRTETVRPWESGVDVVILVILRDLSSSVLYKGTAHQLNSTVHQSKYLTRQLGLVLAAAETWILLEGPISTTDQCSVTRMDRKILTYRKATIRGIHINIARYRNA